MSTAAGLLWLAATLAMIVFIFQKKWKNMVISIILGFIFLCVGVATSPPSSDKTADSTPQSSHPKTSSTSKESARDSASLSPEIVKEIAREKASGEYVDPSAATPKPHKTARPTPEPTPESYEHQQDREKHEFYEQVAHDVTAEEVGGNPTKYVGYNVDFQCVVANIPFEGHINAFCGDGPTNIVLTWESTSDVDQGQHIRVMGTVVDPEQGTNTYGGVMNFPTVEVKFLN